MIPSQTNQAVVTSQVFSSAEQIAEADWQRFFGTSAEGLPYYRTLEAAKLEGFEFCYVGIFRKARLELLAPLFWSDFDLGIAVEGVAKKGVGFIRKRFPRFLVERTLFCGSPFGECGEIGIASEAKDAPELIAELLGTMSKICAEKRLSFMLFKDFREESLRWLESLSGFGFLKGESFPNVVLPLPYATMDDYLGSLSYGARKDLRRKVRKTLAAGKMDVRVVDDVAELIEPVYALYLQTYSAGTVRFEKLTPEYFLEVAVKMRGAAKFFLFYFEGELVCFNLCFVHQEQLIDKFIGMDYAIARRINLYFYTWYHNVQWCLEHGLRQYQIGQTDHGAKVHLGGKLVPLYFYAKHNNALIHAPLSLAARFLMP